MNVYEKLQSLKEKELLRIIKEKRLDVNTYIYNTSNYHEYLFESKHLKENYILTMSQYLLLKSFFKGE